MAQRGHAARSEQVGIAAYLTKPVRQSQLYDCLRTVMGPPYRPSPQTATRPSRIVTAHSLKEAKDLRRPRVLLAEDNQTNQMAAVRMLEMLGYQVDVAVNGIEAVEACRDVDYGIVLMDNQMPEMDGLTATREIRTFELAHGKPPVPIIALTANAMQGDREKCLAAGMNDYLSKPFKVAQLEQVLERWIRRVGCGGHASRSRSSRVGIGAHSNFHLCEAGPTPASCSQRRAGAQTKAVRLIDAAGALVGRHLRVRAERTRAIDLAVGQVRRDDRCSAPCPARATARARSARRRCSALRRRRNAPSPARRTAAPNRRPASGRSS